MKRRLLVVLALVAVLAAAATVALAGTFAGGRPEAGWNDGQKNCPHNVPCQTD